MTALRLTLKYVYTFTLIRFCGGWWIDGTTDRNYI